MDVFGLDGVGGRRPRKTRARRTRKARGDDMDLMGGYYAPYITAYQKRLGKKQGKKKAYQLGRKRMKSIGLNSIDRNNIQSNPKKQSLRQVRNIHRAYEKLPKRKPLARKRNQGRIAVLGEWRNFLEDFKNEHGWYLIKNGQRAYPGSYKQLLKSASTKWHGHTSKSAKAFLN